MGGFSKKKIQKQLSLFLLTILVTQGCFFIVENVQADNPGMAPDGSYESGVIQATVKTQSDKTSNSSAADAPVPQQTKTPGTCGTFDVGCYLWQFTVEMLEMFRNFLFRFLMTPAAVGFAWTVDPATMTGPSGTLNLAAVYALWQFIRDFFNLFFILILLFSAFATIFQVDSFNIRNIFKNILLVALFINFSFPITRFLIDAANVPMYYFINDVLGNGQGTGGMYAMSQMLAYSGTGAAVFTNVDGKDMAPVIMGIVFVFLFSISLFVLGLMMIIRLIALTMLLIFSPIGFAAALIPGFEKYGREWWETFWKYALFGPTAALMLMVSIKFMAAVAGSGVWTNLTNYSSGATPDANSATLLAQVVFFCIPIIMIWFTIGMAGKSSLVGAATIAGLGYAVPKMIGNYAKKGVVGTAKFAGRTAVGTTKAVANRVPVLRSVPGAYAGVKEAFKGDGKLFGKQLIPKPITGDAFNERKEAVEARNARVKGFVQGGPKGANDELRKLEIERVKKGVKEAQEKGVTPEKHLKTLTDDKASTVEKRVAALSLAQQGEIRTATQLADALAAVKGSADEFNQVLDKAKPSAIGSMTEVESQRIYKDLNEKYTDGEKAGQSVYGTREVDIQQAFNGLLKKENKIELKIDEELRKAVSSGTGPTNPLKVYSDNLKMSVNDLAKQSGIIQRAKAGGADPNARAYFEDMVRNDPQHFNKLKGSDSLKKEDAQVLIEIERSIAPSGNQGANSQRSQAWQNAQAAFNQPSNNAGQGGSGQQNP